jgi:hypothetical protein
MASATASRVRPEPPELHRDPGEPACKSTNQTKMAMIKTIIATKRKMRQKEEFFISK